MSVEFFCWFKSEIKDQTKQICKLFSNRFWLLNYFMSDFTGLGINTSQMFSLKLRKK